MKIFTPLTALLLVIATVIFISTSSLVSAMHEDEAGKYDWVAQRVGTPTSASIFKKNIFIATEANTVAALRRKNGHSEWRRVFGEKDEFVCVTPMTNSATGVTTVVAVTKEGVAHFLRGKDGANAAAPISILSSTVLSQDDSVFSCTNFQQSGSVVVFGGSDSSVSAYKIESEGEGSQGFEPRISTLFSEKTSSRPSAAAVASEASTLIVLEDGTSNWIELKSDAKFKNAKFQKIGESSSKISNSINTDGKNSRSVAYVRDDNLVYSAKQNEMKVSEVASPLVACSAEKKAMEVSGVLVESISCDVCSHAVKNKYSTVRVLAVSDGENTPNGEGTAPEPYIATLFTTKSDGAVHFVVVNTQKKAVVKSWSLLHEGLAFPKDIALESATSAAASGSSKFAIATHVFVLSRYNRLYKLARNSEAADYPTIVFNNKVTCCKDPALAISRVDEQTGNVVVKTVSGKEVVVDGNSGEVLVGGCGSSSEEEKKSAGNYFEINKENGEMIGYEILATSGERVDTWRIRVGASSKISAVISDHNILAISSVEHYKAVPNRTSQTTEIRRRYPMANVIVVAVTDNVGALTVSAVDSLTGATLTSSRHPDCGGDNVRLAIAEHTVIYHFFNRAKRRHYVATWEMFEHQTQVLLDSNMVSPALVAQSLVAKRRQFHSATVRAPHVVANVRHFHNGAVSVLGVTHTAQSIARKLIVFVLPNGEALSLALPQLWGTPLKMPEPKNEMEIAVANSVPIAPFDRLTNVNRVARPTLFKSAPSKLESTSRIVVAGLDLWYIPTSAGKPFDRLDDEFNKSGLIMVCCVLPIVALVLRYFAIRRSVNVAWS